MEILVNRLSSGLNATVSPVLEASERNYFLNASFGSEYSDQGNDGAVTTWSYNESGSTDLGNVTKRHQTSTILSLQTIVVLSIMYSIVFVLALVGNISVVTVVAKDKSLHTATNFFLVNMAIADILIAIICLPLTLLSKIFTNWMFGPFLCTAIPYLQGVSVSASVNTLVVIALDRYIAICHVMRQRNTKKNARVILVIIWTFSLLILLPWALYYRQYDLLIDGVMYTVCNEIFPSEEAKKGFFLGVIFLLLYCIPLTLIAVFYFLIGYRVWNRDAPGITSSKGVIEKSKMKVVKMLMVVVLLFMISWMPLYVIRLNVFFFGGNESDPIINTYVNPFAQWLGTSNSCMNPLVYCLFSQKIRRRIWSMLCCAKKEARGLYSTRSMYNSALQQSVSTRDSSIRLDPCANGHGSINYGHLQGSVCYHHRPSRQNSDLIRLNRNNVMSTHV
ncbi:neuropeptide SIFamide receptor-like isoform X1 [Biomphalaria glabrata]|uniref:Neuropeptide SIFamide receptor-like isoform X1 n=2 Tax=Biomphalaria glabrata TaxID=6526 RepID=A0A9W2ZRC0_BIOGL|nr:neuropeptide SIFamide receptor-like isoform X1 [Biomphalaria glabrata]